MTQPSTTERVCVPINPDECLDFNLSSCPKLPVLIKEVNDFLDAQAKKEDSTNIKRAGKNENVGEREKGN